MYPFPTQTQDTSSSTKSNSGGDSEELSHDQLLRGREMEALADMLTETNSRLIDWWQTHDSTG